MSIRKALFRVIALLSITFLSSCFSAKKLNYDFGEAEGYRFYNGFYSTLSDGTDKRPLFDSIEIDGVDYKINADEISTFYYDDDVACLYKYIENQYALINYDILNDTKQLIDTFIAYHGCFVIPNYYPVFYLDTTIDNNKLTTFYLFYKMQLIKSEHELQSINSLGYFTISEKNTFTSFSLNDSIEFTQHYYPIYNLKDSQNVLLNNANDKNSNDICFDSVSFGMKEVKKQRYCQIEKADSFEKMYFRNVLYSIWIEDIDNSLYLNGFGINKAFIIKTPNDYIGGYRISYYEEFHCLTLSHSSFSLTYSLDFQSFSQKTLQFFRDPFLYDVFEDEKYRFTVENICHSINHFGLTKRYDTYLLRYDKFINKYEILQQDGVEGLANVLAYSYVLPNQ